MIIPRLLLSHPYEKSSLPQHGSLASCIKNTRTNLKCETYQYRRECALHASTNSFCLVSLHCEPSCFACLWAKKLAEAEINTDSLNEQQSICIIEDTWQLAKIIRFYLHNLGSRSSSCVQWPQTPPSQKLQQHSVSCSSGIFTKQAIIFSIHKGYL